MIMIVADDMIARTAVHFRDVIERFSPHDTLLDISTAEALNDTSLAASFPLHTASPLPATSNRLQEISEDAEDPGGLAPPSPISGRSSSKNSSLRVRMDRRSEVPRIERLESARRASETSVDGASLSPIAGSKTSLAQFLLRDESGKTSITTLDPLSSSASTSQLVDSTTTASAATSSISAQEQSIAASKNSSQAARSKDDPLPDIPRSNSTAGLERPARSIEPAVRDSDDLRRPSAATDRDNQSAKQSYEDDYDFSKFDALWKPKVKLGPRPVADAEKVKRPTAAAVSGLPANIRQHNAKKPEVIRAEQPVEPKLAEPRIIHAPLPLPPIPDTLDYQLRPVSRGSNRSAMTTKSANTADKARLMKAMELRKKQKRNAAQQTTTPQPEKSAADDVQSSEVSTKTPVKDLGKRLLDNVLEEEGSKAHTSKADSGIGYEKRASGEPPAVSDKAAEVQDPIGVASKSDVAIDSPKAEIASAPDASTEAQNNPAPEPIESLPEIEANFEQQPEQKPDATAENPIVGDALPVIIIADGQQLKTADSPQEENNANPIGASGTTSFVTSELYDSEDEFQDAVGMSRQTMFSRRKGFVEPLQTDMSASGNPDDFASEDEDFLEELQSATVHEAKPMLVSPTSRGSESVSYIGVPRQPSIASISGHSEGVLSVRSISISKPSGVPAERTPEGTTDILMPDMMPDLLMPDMIAFENNRVPQTYTPTGTAPSAATDKNDSLAGYSRNVSSGISRRIQALAELSNREVASPSGYTPSSTRSLTPEMSYLAQDQRKMSQRAGGPTRSNHYKRSSHRSSISHGSTPSNVSENAPVLSFQHDPITNRNSVSVTTRIVRSPPVSGAGESILAEPRLDPDLQLGSGPFSSASHTDLPPLVTNQPNLRSRGVSSASLQSELSPTNTSRPSPSTSEGRVMHSAVTTRFGRHHFPHHYKNPGTISSPLLDDWTNRPSELSHPASRAHSVASTAGTDENGPSARDGANGSVGKRASRFLKRMSNIGTAATGGLRRGSKPTMRGSRESLSLPPAATVNEPRGRTASKVDLAVEKPLPADHPDMPPAVVVGDLNVQFPEALVSDL
jgi:hypothetical protein